MDAEEGEFVDETESTGDRKRKILGLGKDQPVPRLKIPGHQLTDFYT